jgi:hypothetical protein
LDAQDIPNKTFSLSGNLRQGNVENQGISKSSINKKLSILAANQQSLANNRTNNQLNFNKEKDQKQRQL